MSPFMLTPWIEERCSSLDTSKDGQKSMRCSKPAHQADTEKAASSHAPDCHNRCACLFCNDGLLARYLSNDNPSHIGLSSNSGHGMWSSTYDRLVFEGRSSKLASFYELYPTVATKCEQWQTMTSPTQTAKRSLHLLQFAFKVPSCLHVDDILNLAGHLKEPHTGMKTPRLHKFA